MAKIKVKDLSVGMTLIADVCDLNGRFLLGEGCEINEKHIKALNAWGVISAEIRDEDMPVNKNALTISPEIYNTIEQQLATRLIHNKLDHPFIDELQKESIRFFVEQLKG